MSESKQIKLLGFVKIAGQIEALSGLHIGGTADSIDKGGIDSPVIKNPVTNEPYIPGSSLRGRMRALLEAKNGNFLSAMTEKIYMEIYGTKDYQFEALFDEKEFDDFLSQFPDDEARELIRQYAENKGGKIFLYANKLRKPKGFNDKIFEQIQKKLENNENSERAYRLAMESPVCRLFGNSASDPGLPSVLIVRDALMSEKSKKDFMWEGLPITEAKIEIAVDRITAHAMPRTIERVPAGARFDFEMVYKVQTYENGDFLDNALGKPDTKCDEKLRKDLENIFCALEIIQNHSGLGGNTSRGHGQVKFEIKKFQAKRVTGECVKGFVHPGENPTFFDCSEVAQTISFAQYAQSNRV